METLEGFPYLPATGAREARVGQGWGVLALAPKGAFRLRRAKPSSAIATWLCLGVVLCAEGWAAPPKSGAGAPADGQLVPSHPAAADYQAPPLGQVRPGRDADPLVPRVAAEVQKASASVSAPMPLRDGRLDLVASEIARATVGKKLPSFEAIAFLVHHYGLVEPEPYLVMVRGPAQADPTLLNDLSKQIPSVFKMGDWRRVGVGVKRGGDEVTVVLALQPQNLELAPVPRRLPSQGTVLMIGRLLGRYAKPAVLLATPQGRVRNLSLTARKGRFELTLACDSGDGVYQVEIEGDDGHGPAVLANFPVYCGVPAPSGVATVTVDPTRRFDPEEAERELLILVNRDRAAAGLEPVERDARLQEVARAYSREMARTGEVAHVSSKSGAAMDRVRAAKVSPLPNTLAENLGRAFSTREVETAFMGSPGHRANILNADMTHVGIGVAAGQAEGGTVPLFFTQLFAAW